MEATEGQGSQVKVQVISLDTIAVPYGRPWGSSQVPGAEWTPERHEIHLAHGNFPHPAAVARDPGGASAPSGASRQARGLSLAVVRGLSWKNGLRGAKFGTCSPPTASHSGSSCCSSEPRVMFFSVCICADAHWLPVNFVPAEGSAS